LCRLENVRGFTESAIFIAEQHQRVRVITRDSHGIFSLVAQQQTTRVIRLSRRIIRADIIGYDTADYIGYNADDVVRRLHCIIRPLGMGRRRREFDFPVEYIDDDRLYEESRGLTTSQLSVDLYRRRVVYIVKPFEWAK
jgi:hypothetical protein